MLFLKIYHYMKKDFLKDIIFEILNKALEAKEETNKNKGFPHLDGSTEMKN